MRRALIIGGGISGLSAAYYLSKAGVPSTLVERRPRLGGVIETETIHGCVLETGPDSFLSAKPWAMDLIRELGLEGDVIGSNDHARVTYVRKNGRLVPLPDGLMLMIPTKIVPLLTTSLLGWGTKIKMGLEWFRRPDGAIRPDRSVADFIAEHYGQEAVDYLAEPLLAGVYGGDPNKLSVASVLPRFTELEAKYGSLTKGVLHERRKAAKQAKGRPLFQTLKGGLGQLISAMAASANPRLEVVHGTAEALERSAPGWRVRVDGAWLEAANVVLACQAYEAGALISGVDPELGSLLNGVSYSSSITISLGYEKAGFAHPLNGFGFLIPKRERKLVVACTWVATKFSHRVPDNLVVLRCFVGGEDETVLRESDEALVEAVRQELREIMGVTETPVFSRVARWPRSMAQYTVGHQERMKAVEARKAALPGLHLAGNAYTGIGIPDCIRMGKQAAERIREAEL
ncbi:MAG TPA: protoporphyrinogen oxidase [Bryobacteraceae bacterium]|nr:protoporphyrinogen oxidase [Bryobacteraceae bacterium]HPQ17424.1 protoporphyrinogen oxidase [Bryobacteraceae bacterium]